MKIIDDTDNRGVAESSRQFPADGIIPAQFINQCLINDNGSVLIGSIALLEIPPLFYIDAHCRYIMFIDPVDIKICLGSTGTRGVAGPGDILADKNDETFITTIIDIQPGLTQAVRIPGDIDNGRLFGQIIAKSSEEIMSLFAPHSDRKSNDQIFVIAQIGFVDIIHL